MIFNVNIDTEIDPDANNGRSGSESRVRYFIMGVSVSAGRIILGRHEPHT